MESRVAMLEQIARTTTLGLERLDQRMDSFDHRMGGFDRRMDGFDRRMEGVERRMDVMIAGQRADFRWVVGLILTCIFTVIGLFGTMLGVMAHGFHWL
jgi:hypothetical protein